MGDFDWEFVPDAGGVFSVLSKAEAENMARMMPGKVRHNPIANLSATYMHTSSGRKVELGTGRDLGPSNEWRPKARAGSRPTSKKKPRSTWMSKIPRLKRGNVIVFEDDRGRSRRGTVESVRGSSLTVVQDSGDRWKVPATSVTRLLRASVYDGSRRPARRATRPSERRTPKPPKVSLSYLVSRGLSEAPDSGVTVTRLVQKHLASGKAMSRHSLFGLPLVITSRGKTVRVAFAMERKTR